MKVILIIYGLNIINSVLARHFDTRFPIVIHDLGKGTAGSKPSYNMFGYSLAFLEGYLDDNESVQMPDARHTLFIGAPNETKYTTNSGVVWSCEFNGNGNPPVKCSILTRISETNGVPKNTCRNDEYFKTFETQTQQWIGANVNIHPSSRELLTCAPRWKFYAIGGCKGDVTMPGACYLVSKTSVTLFKPLHNSKTFHYNVTENNKIVTKNLNRYAEFGFSSHFTDYGNLIVGAPQTRSATGEMQQVDPLKAGSNSLTIYNNFSDIGVESYNGYAVTSGRTSSEGLYFVSGAPRARRLHGAVTISYPNSSRMSSVFEGEQLGSYFGYALATLDLNSDGFDELLVGAPFYTPETKSGQSGYNTGCVLIFNLAQNTTRPIAPKLCMEPQQVSSRSHFGSAIAKIGDINFDQYDDFAISAPYDDDWHGTVFIYHGGFPLSSQPVQIVYGKSFSIPGLRGFGNYLLSGKKVDIDGNTAPDLVIGAFESRHVIVLRSRLVASVFMKISFHSSESTGSTGEIHKYPLSRSDIRVMSCIILNVSNSLSSSQKIETWLNFELGPTLPQVQFVNSDDLLEQSHLLQFSGETCIDTKLRVLEYIDTSNTEDSLESIEFRVSLKYNQTETLSGSHANVIIPNPTTEQQRQYLSAYNSFNPYLPIPIPQTYSEWAQLPVAIDNCDNNGNPLCEPDLKLRTKLLYGILSTSHDLNELKIDYKPFVIGQLEKLVAHINVINENETAYEPTVWITLGVSESFNMNVTMLTFNWKIEGKLTRCKNFNEITSENFNGTTIISLGYTCSVVIQPGKELTFTLEIGNWGHLRVSDMDQGNMTLKVEAFPKQNPSQSAVEENFQFPLEANVNIEVKSSVPDQSGIDPDLAQTQYRFVDISQYFIITNTGFSETINEAITAEILVPTHFNLNSSDSNLTQFIWVASPSTSTNTSSANIRCTADNYEFFTSAVASQDESKQNPSSLYTNSNDTGENMTSMTTMVMPPEVVATLEKGDKYITFSGCEGETELYNEQSCQKITCKMDLQPGASVPREIRLQLYISRSALNGLVHKDIKGIRVKSMISIYYQGRQVATEVGVTQRTFLRAEGISVPILLGAGVGGIVLLILVTFVLYQCGFFRRRYNEELQKLLKQQIVKEDQEEIIQLALRSRETQQYELTL